MNAMTVLSILYINVTSMP